MKTAEKKAPYRGKSSYYFRLKPGEKHNIGSKTYRGGDRIENVLVDTSGNPTGAAFKAAYKAGILIKEK